MTESAWVKTQNGENDNSGIIDLCLSYVDHTPLGTVKNHGKKVQKTRHTFKKITKNTAKTRHQNAMYF